MTEPDFFWLVGILEGEGTFVAGPPSAPNQPRIALEMKDEDIVAKVAGMLGQSYIQSRKVRGEWSACFRTCIRASPAVAWMRKLRPFMGIRRQQQIDKAILGHVDRERGNNAKRLAAAEKNSIIQKAGDRSISSLALEYGISRGRVRRILQ